MRPFGSRDVAAAGTLTMHGMLSVSAERHQRLLQSVYLTMQPSQQFMRQTTRIVGPRPDSRQQPVDTYRHSRPASSKKLKSPSLIKSLI